MLSGIGFVLLAALGISQPAKVEIGPNGIIAGKARFQVLSNKLVRMEYSPTGLFTDVPTAVVCNRLKPVPAIVETANYWATIKTNGYTIRYKLGSEFKPDSLKVS